MAGPEDRTLPQLTRELRLTLAQLLEGRAADDDDDLGDLGSPDCLAEVVRLLQLVVPTTHFGHRSRTAARQGEGRRTLGPPTTPERRAARSSWGAQCAVPECPCRASRRLP
ncbi:hypothetical protein GFH48_19170 [Streptomyces fagopyri]|uniref:Uncharacterized protein n=1 Tax=Streptomyces fagopyri TaxID=2662397 RepID=A0A5Q0LF24_9ACTN|nr:hypothetical protein GFH48_19170 [Streptomyces fagopyri]